MAGPRPGTVGRGRPAEALEAYEATLQDSPRRLNALAGAVEAAHLSGDRARARAHERELASLCGAAGCPRRAGGAVPASLRP